MFRPLMTVAAVILGLAASVPVQCQILDRWFVREIYSNVDGSVQFVKIEIDFDMHPQNGLVGKTLVASNGSAERSFTFTRFIDCVLCTFGDLKPFGDYFITAYPTGIEMLDSAPSSGWQRTGLTFTAWTAAFSVKAGETEPSNLLPVCRVWLGNSHFYSILATECADVANYPAYL